MWRIPRLAVPPIFVLGLVLSSVPAFTQSLPNKKEAREWVRRAQEASDLQSPDAPPYHLVAKIRYTINDKTMDGTYEILWAAPDRYRVEFRMGDIGETDLVLGDKKYVLRTTPTMTLPMWSTSSLLFFSTPLRSPPYSLSVHKLSWAGDMANRQICASVGESVTLDNKLCFDAKTMEVTARHTQPIRNSQNFYRSVIDLAVTADLTDYASLGKMRYPQHLERRSGPESIVATVEKWEAVQKFDESVFVPLPNSTAWDWCSTPKIEMQSNLPYLPSVGAGGTLFIPYIPYFGLYRIIRADGTVKEATLLFGSPEGRVKEMLDMQRHTRSAVHICGGKPVEYETMLVMWLAALPDSLSGFIPR